MTLCGIVLAAGAGTRLGGPKVLQPGWLDAACATLTAGGCDRVVVVLGAAPNAPVPEGVEMVIAEDWAHGMSRSLAAGLLAADSDDALITLVDLPGLTVAVVERVLAAEGALRQAVFKGRPGHPVFVSSAHTHLIEAAGDHGARGYLIAHGVVEVECSDLWAGSDIDS